MLDDNLVLRSLPPDVVNRLKPRLHPQRFATGDVLYATDDRIGFVYFPGAGAILLVSELTTGEMIETAMIGRDSVIGGSAVFDDRNAGYKAVAQVDGTGFVLDIATARQIAIESEPFRTAIAHHEQLILAQAQQSAACNAVHSLDQRLARWLLRIRDVTGSDTFMLTQDFMAHMLGVRRTSVSLAANAFRGAGLINYQRGKMTIVRADELQQKACECYSTIKKHYGRLGASVEILSSR